MKDEHAQNKSQRNQQLAAIVWREANQLCTESFQRLVVT
jgi:hypothetical protein